LPISAVDAISPAFQHTKQQLTKPFRFGQWWRLAFVGLLAGELSSGGGCNSFQVPSFPRNTGSPSHFLAAPFSSADPALFAALIGVLVVLGLILGVFFIYISSVMRFVLFDSVLARECHIRQSWSRRTDAGFRYFVWQLLFAAAMIAGLVILIGIPAAIGFAMGWLKQPDEHVLPLVLGGILLFFLFFAFIVLSLIVQVLTKDFVIPQMALENISALEGWRRLWPKLDQEKGGFAGYIGMKIVMAIGAAVLVGIVVGIAALVILIPVGGLGVVAVLGGKAAGLTWNLYTITLAVVVGCVVVGVILYVMSLLSVPVVVFFPAYSIHFFAARYPALAAVLYPAPPAPPQAPPSLPPLPPEPLPAG
jgi:hypothetical protein